MPRSDSATPNMALFCDFENVALGVRDARYDAFDIKRVLERLLLKGSIVVKKAYCDWERYKDYKTVMHQAAFELIEIPQRRVSGKNSADIRMVVDALDLCYTKAHVDCFVIISGDSDFSPLVSKLRENDKTVIGVGVKNSTSDLLISNCDEFIFYDDLVRESRRRGTGRAKAPGQDRTNGDRTAPDRAVAEKAVAEKAVTDKAAPEKPAAGKAVADKAVADKAGAEKAAVEKAAAGKPVAEKPAAGKPGARRGRGAKSEAAAAADGSAATIVEIPAVLRAEWPQAADIVPQPVLPQEPRPEHEPALVSGEPAAELADDEPVDGEARLQRGLDLVVETLDALVAERGEDDRVWGSMIKQTLKRRNPGFNEGYYGFKSFNRMLEEARDRGLIALDVDAKSGGYVVRSL